jgi:CHASE2 domain-containing sensor protein
MHKRSVIAYTLCTVMVAALVGAGHFAGLGDAFYNLNFLVPSRMTCDSVVVVGIDAASINQIGAWPWPRGMQARLFERINACKPRVVAADILFPRRPEDRPGTDSLLAVFSRINSVVLPFRIDDFGDVKPELPVAPDIYPHRFRMFANRDGLVDRYFFSAKAMTDLDSAISRIASFRGFINIATLKTSQTLREIIHVVRFDKEYYPSFAIAAIAAFLDCKPDKMVLDGKGRIILDDSLRIPLSSYAASTYVNFRGSAGSIATISAASLLNGAVSSDLLRGRLVFVGITDPAASSDFFITPVGSDFPGIEVWATAAADILQKRWISHGGSASLLNALIVLLIFPGLALLFRGRRAVLIIAGVGIVALSVCASAALFHFAWYFWDPRYHLFAFIGMVLWAVLQKDAAVAPVLDFEPVDHGRGDLLPPPQEQEFLSTVPDADTAQYVKKQIEAQVAAGSLTEAEKIARIRQICNGTIIRLLGCGGMADVYQIWNARQDVYRAVKVIKPGQPAGLLNRFETEIKIHSNLDHPSIVHCYNVGSWHGLPCIEMEYVHGVSLENHLARCGRFSVEETLAVGIIIARALHYAHNRHVAIEGKVYEGIIHRDLKPANILLSRGGRIKLSDLGIARPQQVSIHTQESTAIVGTLPYLAPEQIDGRNIDGRADLYALGATLYEFLTGRRAWPQEEMTVLLSAKSIGRYIPIKASGAIPDAVIDIVNTSLALNPDDRYPSAETMCKEMEKVWLKTVKKQGIMALQGLVKRYWG